MKYYFSNINRLPFCFLLIEVCLLHSCVDEKAFKNNDLKKLNLQGRVHKVTEIAYTASDVKFGEISKIDKMQEFTYLFDRKGYYSESSMTNPFSNSFFKTTYKYKGNILVEECSFEPNKEMPTSRIVNILNDKNIISETKYYGSDGIEYQKDLYMYDNKSQRLEENAFNSDNKFLYRIIFKYDDSGNLSEKCSYSVEGNLDEKVTYEYDDSRNQIEECHYNGIGQLYYKSSTKYHDNGIVAEISNLHQGFPYDDLNEHEVNKYDDMGNNIETSKYDLNGSLKYRFIYKYKKIDKYGNWLVKEDIREVCNIKNYGYIGSINKISEREIEYY